MIIIAGINMITALLVLILERVQMIGILKALGSNNTSIRKVFLYNASYLILKGLFWGNIIGLSIIGIQYLFWCYYFRSRNVLCSYYACLHFFRSNFSFKFRNTCFMFLNANYSILYHYKN